VGGYVVVAWSHVEYSGMAFLSTRAGDFMKLIEQYITKNVLSAIGLITLMLAGLQIFILFINQIDSLGKGQFDLWSAVQFVLLQLPYQVYLFFPMASLLGCLVGLGMMANYRELVVLRAAGLSIFQISIAVFKGALVLILLVTLLSETIVPKLSALGNAKRLHALSNGQTLKTEKGLWLKSGKDFLFIGEIVSERLIEDIYQFQFDDAHILHTARKIQKAVHGDKGWIAVGVEETHLDTHHISSRSIEKMPWPIILNPKILRASTMAPDEMTLGALKRYLHFQKHNGANDFTYRLVYWQRVLQPFTTLVMLMLAIPFIFGPLRSSTMGSKLLIGAVVGFGFYIANRFFGPMFQVFQWSAEVAAFGPTLIFFILGLGLMRYKR